jgi:hypothetical protein
MFCHLGTLWIWSRYLQAFCKLKKLNFLPHRNLSFLSLHAFVGPCSFFLSHQSALPRLWPGHTFLTTTQEILSCTPTSGYKLKVPVAYIKWDKTWWEKLMKNKNHETTTSKQRWAATLRFWTKQHSVVAPFFYPKNVVLAVFCYATLRYSALSRKSGQKRL